jgi:hypothetical protein
LPGPFRVVFHHAIHAVSQRLQFACGIRSSRSHSIRCGAGYFQFSGKPQVSGVCIVPLLFRRLGFREGVEAAEGLPSSVAEGSFRIPALDLSDPLFPRVGLGGDRLIPRR